ncbi:hypothetical protein DPSP01_012774 [Paraphaeosphaeria sporulosa]
MANVPQKKPGDPSLIDLVLCEEGIHNGAQQMDDTAFDEKSEAIENIVGQAVKFHGTSLRDKIVGSLEVA